MLKKTGILILVFAFFSITIHASGNLLQNPGFEDSDNLLPAGWSSSAFKNTSSDVVFSVANTNAFEGNNCLSISNISENDSKLSQEIMVVPGSIYRASCRIKTENILNQAGSANITLELANNYGIYTSRELSDTNGNWELLEFCVRIPQEAEKLLKFSLRLGGQGVLNKGTAYFDEVVFELLENPGELPVEEFFIPSKSSNSGISNTQEQSSSSGTTILFIILAFIIVALIIFVELKLKKGIKGSGLSESDNNDFIEDSDDEFEEEYSDDNDDELDEEQTEKDTDKKSE